MKNWLTVDEIAALRLPGLPATKRGMNDLALREHWIEKRNARGEHQARLRAGRGGGIEYHIDLLPADSLAVYAAQSIGQQSIPDDLAAAAASEETAASLNGAALEQRDARLAIVAAAKSFARNGKLPLATADTHFCALYNARKIVIDGWIVAAVREIAPRTLRRWRDLTKKGSSAKLAIDRGATRRGKSWLDTAANGDVRTYCLALVARQPHLSADHVRTLCADRFDTALPPVRAFQRALKAWKQEHAVALTKITNPDAFKSRFRTAGRNSHPVERLNELWQIDASPADVLLKDGRYSIYACVDIFSRRLIVTVTKTPRASAVCLLMRKAIYQWGVPERVKTDNGSDFVARETKRLFLSLGIETETSDPFSPEQKGHIERAIGTLQRDLMPLLPGFIGHNVADRKAIEGRRAFAQRLGESDDNIFCVDLDAHELQTYCDDWANQRYAHRPHDGLKGRSPFAAASAFPGTIRRINDTHSLDMLLAPVAGGGGLRKVSKSGVRVDGSWYLTPTVLPGADVLVRMDGADMGRAFLFSPDGAEYLGEAICPHLAGVDPGQAVAAARAEQKRILDEGTADIRKQMRAIKPRDMVEAVTRQAAKNAGKLVEFPKPSEGHSTPQLDAAREAMDDGKGARRAARTLAPAVSEDDMRALETELAGSASAPRKPQAARAPGGTGNVTRLELQETKEQRFARALAFEARLAAGELLPTDDALWLGGYRSSSEYRAMAAVYEDFGEAALR